MARVGATVEALDSATGAEFGAAMIDRLSVTAPSSLRLLAPDGERAGAAVLHQLHTFCELVGDFPALPRVGPRARGGQRRPGERLRAARHRRGHDRQHVRRARQRAFEPEDLAAWRSAVCLVDAELMR